jgi:predicted CXXCH cytochrome family protein
MAGPWPGGLCVGRVLTAAAVLVSSLATRAALGQLPPKPAAPEAKILAQTCTTECHKDIANRKVMHGPAQGDCAACHIQTGDPKDHAFSFLVPTQDLCVRCHALPHENSTHAPVKLGQCMECHDPHGSDHVHVLVADPVRDLCLKCHKQDFAKAKFVHGPVAIGACVVCHQAHSSSLPKLLTQDPKALCLGCHGEIHATPQDGLKIHAALEQGCTGCHNPHASDHKFQLHQTAPGLCLSCHKDQFDQIAAGAKVVHGAVTTDGGCVACHEPHASRQPALQRGVQPDTCLTCHDKPLKTANGSVVANMAAHFKANPNRHGPIREGDCTACHNPHAGQNFRLLTEAYPAPFYAPFSADTFKLCFRCHSQDLALKPVGTGLTKFRNGELNLHYLHVNQEKGRTCRACHEVHASTNPAHIREAVPFGNSGWMLRLNYEQTANGGSCAPGCHTPKTYNRSGLMPDLNALGASP